MSEAQNRTAIELLVDAINTHNLAVLDRVFTNDSVIEWPQSGECINGGDHRRAI